MPTPEMRKQAEAVKEKAGIEKQDRPRWALAHNLSVVASPTASPIGKKVSVLEMAVGEAAAEGGGGCKKLIC